MKEFTFDPQPKVKICGEIYEISIAEKAKDAAKNAEKILNEMAENKSENEEAAVDVCFNAIDQYLGIGASEKIFSDRGKKLIDCIAVINFLAEAINELK